MIDTGVALDNLNFRYAISGDDPPWRPVRAFDDGSKVYIEFPDRIDQGEAPPLFVVGADGGSELVNYRVRGNYYIVDRLFAAAELRLGEGQAADRPHQPDRCAAIQKISVAVWRLRLMTSTQPPKLDPESLVLARSPRRVVRFKRNLLIGIAAIACLAIFGATWLALGQSSAVAHHRPARNSTTSTASRRPTNSHRFRPATTSSDWARRCPAILGRPIVAREKSLGLSPTDASFKPNPEDDAARAERMRRAQQAQQANEAGVFFQTRQHRSWLTPAAALRPMQQGIRAIGES